MMITLQISYNEPVTIRSSLNFNENKLFKVGNTVIEGKDIKYYKNGNKEYEHNYKNGKDDGLSVGWYENGNKSYKWNYKNGKLDGLLVGWYENGNKRYERNYKDGLSVD